MPSILSVFFLFCHSCNLDESLFSWAGLNGCYSFIHGTPSKSSLRTFYIDSSIFLFLSIFNGVNYPLNPRTLAPLVNKILAYVSNYSGLSSQVQNLLLWVSTYRGEVLSFPVYKVCNNNSLIMSKMFYYALCDRVNFVNELIESS